MKTKTKHILIAVLLIWFAPAITQALYQPIGIVKMLIQNQFLTVFSSTYDTATPAGSDSPSEADDRMREIKAAVQERENVDHYWPLTGTEVSDADTGEHRKILFHAPIAATPTVAADHGDLRIADVVGKAELHWTDEDENEVQMTSVGKILGDSLKNDSVDEDAIQLDNNSFLTGVDLAGTGTVNLILASVGDSALIAHSVANPARLQSDAPPVSGFDIANKKYVDDQNTAQFASGGPIESIFGSWTNLDSLSDTLVKDEVYKASSDGFVTVYDANGASASITIFTDSSNPPTSGRNSGFGSNGGNGVCCLVKKNEFWKIVTATTPNSINWLPIGSGESVKQ